MTPSNPPRKRPAKKRWTVEEVAFGGLCVERDGQEVSAEELVALLNAAGIEVPARKGRKT